ncbi:hypothetical protein ABT282_07665 [Streptomyces sp. NPDC000927]|uniref:hypothetical protein n=1 Tax=Streptomyces sp. NPDC000927 TaxID=3154371 RepID=UPI00332E36EC
MEPKLLHEFVHDMAEWMRRSAAPLWCGKAAQGSPFYWPPGLADPSKDALALRETVYEGALAKRAPHHIAHGIATSVQQDATVRHYEELAAFHAATLERARLLYVGKDIAYLAAKTEMREFRLDLDLLRPTPEAAPSSCGFVMWDTPIGEAEPRGKLVAEYNRSGDLVDVEMTDDIMEGFRHSDTPVNAASWRILPGSSEILLVFYSDGFKARVNYEEFAAAQKAPPGMSLDRDAMLLQASDPQPLEREQVLPLGKTLGWFDDEGAEERLRVTVESDPSYLRIAERNMVADKFVEANEKVRPMLSQMVKTFVATLAIRRMKLASREEVPAPQPSRKRMRRGGASEERVTSGVELIRIGKPLQHRSKAGGSGGGKWKVKTIIGPVIRTRQYVPAYDEYRQGIWEIEPYIAGPADAPWSEKAKVFLLE